MRVWKIRFDRQYIEQVRFQQCRYDGLVLFRSQRTGRIYEDSTFLEEGEDFLEHLHLGFRTFYRDGRVPIGIRPLVIQAKSSIGTTRSVQEYRVERLVREHLVKRHNVDPVKVNERIGSLQTDIMSHSVKTDWQTFTCIDTRSITKKRGQLRSLATGSSCRIENSKRLRNWLGNGNGWS